MKYCTIMMTAIPLLLLGVTAMTTTNHTAYACGDDYGCGGLGLGVGFHHWFYHYHWGIGLPYHWPWHRYWGIPSCCNTYEGSGPAAVVGTCSVGCVGDDQIPATTTTTPPCCDASHQGYDTDTQKTYQSTQQTTNNYVTVNGNNNYVGLNQNQRQASEQLPSNQGPTFQFSEPQAQGCCGTVWNNGPVSGASEDP